MKKLILISWVGILSLLYFGCVHAAKVSTGEKAPDFTLSDIEGQEHHLKNYKGKYVVLEWVNHGCPYVKKHYNSGNMQKLQKEWTQKNVVWLSVCSSAPGKQGYYDLMEWKEVHKEKKSHASAVLLDSNGKVGKKYGAKTTPHMFIINPEGNLVYQGAIDEMKDFDDDVLKIKNYVQLALSEAMSGKKVSDNSTKPYGCSVKY